MKLYQANLFYQGGGYIYIYWKEGPATNEL